MRKINKNQPYQEFVDFIRGIKSNDWNQLDSSVRRNTREYILNNEQFGLSGYTERKIDLDSSHIDHFVQRDDDPKQTFLWKNLIVDEIEDRYGARHKDNKIQKGDYSHIINPVEERAEDYFYYSQTGMIEPINNLDTPMKNKAKRTIELFNLNHKSLVEEIRDLIKIINSYKSQLDKNSILFYLGGYGFTSLKEQELSN